MAETPTSSSAPAYEFADFTLDLVRGQLRRGDQRLPLRPKAFELLAFLVRNADRLLSKAELLDAVWESLEADALSLTDAQRAELDYRIERHEQNPSDVVPWEQVRAGLFKKP